MRGVQAAVAGHPGGQAVFCTPAAMGFPPQLPA